MANFLDELRARPTRNGQTCRIEYSLTKYFRCCCDDLLAREHTMIRLQGLNWNTYSTSLYSIDTSINNAFHDGYGVFHMSGVNSKYHYLLILRGDVTHARYQAKIDMVFHILQREFNFIVLPPCHVLFNNMWHIFQLELDT